jgi:hypothetical protein
MEAAPWKPAMGTGDFRGLSTSGQTPVRARRPGRVPIAVASRSLVLAAIASLVFVASAQSCTTAPSGLWEGTFSGTYNSGKWKAFPTPGTEVAPGVFSFTGQTWAEGNSTVGLGAFNLEGAYTNATVNCAGEETFKVFWGGTLYGSPVSGFEVNYTGLVGPTTAVGNYSDTYQGVFETGTWSNTTYPAAQSQGTLPGSVGVVNPPGTQTSSFTAEPVSPSQLPPGVVPPVGALAFTVNNAPALGTIDVTLVLPLGSGPTAVYKSANGVYELYPAAKTKIKGNEITLELTDNEAPWDENPAVGVIGDPVVPVEAQLGPAPTIKKLSPKKGPAGGETPVTITGTGFTGATRVKFGSNEAHFTVNSPTSITVTSPAGTPGAAEVSVTTRNGGSGASSKDRFTYKKPKKKK